MDEKRKDLTFIKFPITKTLNSEFLLKDNFTSDINAYTREEEKSDTPYLQRVVVNPYTHILHICPICICIYEYVNEVKSRHCTPMNGVDEKL